MLIVLTLAQATRNTLYKSLSPKTLNCTFWKTGYFCSEHRDWMQDYNSLSGFCQWHKPPELVGLWTATGHGDRIMACVSDER